MLKAFLASFITGILLGKVVILTLYQIAWLCGLIGIILIPLLVVKRALLASVSFKGFVVLLFAMGGFSWGYTHSGPLYEGPCTPISNFQLLRRNPFQKSGPTLIERDDGRIFELLHASHAGGKIGSRRVSSGVFEYRMQSLACSGAGIAKRGMIPLFRSEKDFPQLTSWVGATIFARRGYISYRIQRCFRNLGLSHLLVVSGLHVGLFAGFILLLLRSLPHLLYALCWISPGRWKQSLYMTEIVAVVCIFVYVGFLGWPQSAQRAAFFFATFIASKWFMRFATKGERLLFCASLQSLLFPIGFLSVGNLMSWAVSLLLFQTTGERHTGALRTVLGGLKLQAKISLLSVAMFSEFSVWALPANLLLAPGFGFVLCISYLAVLLPFRFLVKFADSLVGSYLGLIENLSDFLNHSTDYAFIFRGIPGETRFVCLLLSVWFLLNTLRELSIERHRIS